MIARKATKFFNVASTITRLHLMRKWNIKSVVDFSLSNKVLETLQVPSELHRFAAIVEELKPKTLLEIGTNKGGTLCVLARLATPDATVISLDLPGGEFGGGYRGYHVPLFKSFTHAKQKLHLLRGDSHSEEMKAAVTEALGTQKLDLFFIDGDHTYQGVKKDFENYSGLVRSGGVIAFHDIAEHPPEIGCEVSRLWSEVKLDYRHEEIIEARSQGWAGIGILYV